LEERRELRTPEYHKNSSSLGAKSIFDWHLNVVEGNESCPRRRGLPKKKIGNILRRKGMKTHITRLDWFGFNALPPLDQNNSKSVLHVKLVIAALEEAQRRYLGFATNSKAE